MIKNNSVNIFIDLYLKSHKWTINIIIIDDMRKFPRNVIYWITLSTFKLFTTNVQNLIVW